MTHFFGILGKDFPFPRGIDVALFLEGHRYSRHHFLASTHLGRLPVVITTITTIVTIVTIMATPLDEKLLMVRRGICEISRTEHLTAGA